MVKKFDVVPAIHPRGFAVLLEEIKPDSETDVLFFRDIADARVCAAMAHAGANECELRCFCDQRYGGHGMLLN
jgi:hypothetical protein